MIALVSLSEKVHVGENGEQAVISLLSKLLLNRQSQTNNTRAQHKYIKNMKIEIEVDPTWLTGNLPVQIEVKDRQMEERRKKRSVRDSETNDDLELALRIPSQYIVVVVSSNLCTKVVRSLSVFLGPIEWLLALTGRALDWTIEGLLVQASPPTESLYYVLEQDTLSAA